ncbi:MAG TPA: hypothetical protein VD993_14840 [Chitinophagaceae bacterium]|nr:hypothetical protein [Chitinophagaceae bacterium]
MAKLESLQKTFSSPVVSVVAFVVAVVALNAWQAVLPNFHFDNSFSVAAARNVAEGNGFVTHRVLPENLSQEIYEPINKWPPGYSWMLAGTMRVSALDAVESVYVVNGLVIIFFLLGIYLTLTALRFPTTAVNGFMVFAGFFPYAFLGAWFADLAAVSFLTLAIGLIMRAHSQKTRLIIKAVVAALLCGYCIFLKYLYLPVAILPLVVWGWHSLRTQQRRQFAAAFTGSVIVMTAAVLLLLYQSRHSGQPVYVNPTGRGFFPEHVLEIGALIPASLVDQEFMTVQLSRLFRIKYNTAELLLRIVNYVLMAGLCYWVIKWWRSGGSGSTEQARKGRGRWNRNLYAYIVLVVSAATAGMLLFMSLTFAPYTGEFTPFWTYVEELRYYAIVIVFLQQWVFWYFVVYRPQHSGLLYKIARALVIVMVLSGILHSAYYLCKQVIIKKEVGTQKVNEQTDIAALEVVKRLKEKHPDLVICSNNHELANIASLSGAPVLYDYNALNDSLKTSRPIMLVAIIRDDFSNRFAPFFERYKPVKVDHRYNFSFYLAAIR